MTREYIVELINKNMYEELYGFDDVKDKLDDAIIAINNTMHTTFPMITEILTTESSEYTYEVTDPDTGVTSIYPIFPEKYMRSVVIEFAVSELFRRQGEFGPEYQSAVQAYERGLSSMFQNYYERVPEQYIDENTGIIPITPSDLNVETEVDGTPKPSTELDLTEDIWDPTS